MSFQGGFFYGLLKVKNQNGKVYLCVLTYRIMEAIRLEFQPEIKEKILKLLSSFTSDELKIVQENDVFDPKSNEDKRKLEIAYAKLKNGDEKLYSIDEANSILDDTFSEYDN